jgi:hypothetical protein
MVGVRDFFIFRWSLRSESSQEHLPRSIAGVPSAGSGQALRLRARKLSVCDRYAKRFAQDDGFVGGLQYNWLDMQKTPKDRGFRDEITPRNSGRLNLPAAFDDVG